MVEFGQSMFSAVVAEDRADYDPYPISHWQAGDNGGYGFGPWVALQRGTPGSRYLGGRIVPGHLRAWTLSGTYAFGRSLAGPVHGGICRVIAVHGAGNTAFSGFNLKATALPGYAADELVRFGIHPGAEDYDGGTVQVSTNGGAAYRTLDCGVPLGLGDIVEYAIMWSATGAWWLTVSNLSEEASASFTGTMAPEPVMMLGAIVQGATMSENLAFDCLALESEGDARPLLTIRRHSSDRFVCAWPAPAHGWRLQEATSLTGAIWSDVAELPQPVADGWEVVLPLARPPAARFYRLTK